MSAIIRDVKGLVILMFTVVGIIGTLQFTVWASNQYNRMLENPQEGAEIIPDVVERGTQEIVNEVTMGTILEIIVAGFTVLYGLAKAIEKIWG